MTNREHAEEAAYNDSLFEEQRDREKRMIIPLALNLTRDEIGLLWDLLRSGQAKFVNHAGPVNELMDKIHKELP